MDFNHGEYGERESIASILDSVSHLPESVFVQNKGKETPWRVSLIVCAKQVPEKANVLKQQKVLLLLALLFSAGDMKVVDDPRMSVRELPF